MRLGKYERRAELVMKEQQRTDRNIENKGKKGARI